MPLNVIHFAIYIVYAAARTLIISYRKKLMGAVNEYITNKDKPSGNLSVIGKMSK